VTSIVLVVLVRGGLADPPDLAETAPRLHLIWYDPLCCIPRAFFLLQKEVDRIFGEIGIPVTWEKNTMTRGHPEAVNVSVILVGHHKKLPGFNHNVLGSFQYKPPAMRKQAIWRSVLIYLPNIVRTLGYPLRDDDIAIDSRILRQLNRPKELCELSRSIGRIIAHEVVHAVSPDIPHTPDGLMCMVPKCHILFAGKMRFPPQYENEFRSDLKVAILAKENRPTPVATDARSQH
jgi:hypothetical protein